MYEEIRAKIAELKNKNEVTDEEAPQYEFDVACGYDMALDDVLSFLSTLESEKPMNQEGLDEEIESYWKENGPMSHAQYDRLAKCARHFAQWGAEHFRDSTKMMETPKDLEEAAEEYRKRVCEHPMYFTYTKQCFIAGAKWQKEQMMSEAVEGKVFMSFVPGHNQMVMADVDLPTNTKVRVIVLPKED